MTTLLLTLILMLLWMPMCALCVMFGFYLSKRHGTVPEREISEEELRKKKQEERELKNFWSYNGDSQSR